MTVSAVSSDGGINQAADIQNKFQQFRTDFQQLSKALQSGDLAGAQQAYTSLMQVVQAGAQNKQDSTISNDFAALGQALQSGDMTAAQKAFSTLQQDMKSAGQTQFHHHRHHSVQSADDSSASSSATTLLPGAGNNPATQVSGSGVDVEA